MNSPPIIYLDTADFSRFSDVISGRSDPIAESVLEFLIPLVDSEKIRVCYTSSHLSELLKYNDGGRDLTLRKAATIERLCGRNALCSLNDIFLKEMHDLAVKERLTRENKKFSIEVYSPVGKWYPSSHSAISDLPNYFDEDFDRILKDKGLPRPQRRKLKSTFFRSPEWKPQVEILIESMKKRLADYPGIDEIVSSGDFIQTLERKTNPIVLENRIMSSITSPSNFVIYYFEKFNGDRNYLPSWMKDFSSIIFNEVSLLVKKCNESMDDLSLEEINAILDKTADNYPPKISVKFIEKAKDHLSKMGLGTSSQVQLKAVAQNSPLPSTVLFSELLRVYMKTFIVPKSQPKPKPSDGADMVHALYIPYCNVWRGDKRTGLLFKALGIKHNTRTVHKLEELPTVIQSLL